MTAKSNHPPRERTLPATNLLLIGGSVRAAAEDAAAAGYRIVAVDRFGDFDLRAISAAWIPLTQADGWLAAARSHAGPIVPTGGFIWPAAPLDENLCQRVAYPTPDRLETIRDPDRLRGVARDVGIHFPETLPLTPLAIASLADPADWLVKPVAGTGGAGIRALADFLRTGSTAMPGYCQHVQRRLLGRTIGVSYFARRGGKTSFTRLLGICAGLTHRLNPQHRWLYGGSIGPFDTDWPDREAARGRLTDLGRAVAEAFDLVGLFNLDLIRQPDGSLWLLEINPRYSASMELLLGHPEHRERSLIDAHVAAYQERAGTLDTTAAGRRTDWLQGEEPLIPDGNFACKRIVYARRPVAIPLDPTDWQLRAGLERVDSAQQTAVAGGDRFRISLHDLPAPPLPAPPLPEPVLPAESSDAYGPAPLPGATAVVEAGMPVLTVIVRGAGRRRDCLRMARKIESRITAGHPTD